MNNNEIKLPDNLYHYTSKEEFLGIIENKTLWASGILYMNDEKETRIPLEIFEELLKEERNVDIREKFERIYKPYRNLFESFIGFETYVISFSEKRDDLNQWRAYGDNASGICIEFNSNSLLQALKNNQEKSEDGREKIIFEWKKCIYDKEGQKKQMQSLLDSIKRNSDLNPIQFSEKLLEFSTYFKDESFKSEQEWRIVVKLRTELENRALKKVRVRKDIFVPYCELRIERDKLPIESEGKYPLLSGIVVGSATTDVFYESVKQACAVHGIGFGKVLGREPRKSDIPYRG